MREEDRLRRLQMRVAGHDRVGVRGAPACRARGAARRCRARRPSIGVADVEPQVEGDLIVAAARRVQLAADRADHLDQAPLDRHVDVLVAAAAAWKRPRSNSRRIRPQAADDARRVARAG